VAGLGAALLLAAIALVVPTAAQPPHKVYRLTYLSGSSASARTALLAAFKQGMRGRGYVEGQQFVLEARFAAGAFERLPALAREIVALNPDLIFVSTTPASLAAKAATMTVPIVFVGVADPVGVGLVPSIPRPGGNVTGITNIVAELTGKRLELLKELLPRVSRVAVMVNPDDPNAAIQLRHAQSAARALGVELRPVVHVRAAADIEPAFEAAVRAGAGLRMVDPTVTMLRGAMTAAAARHRLPVVYAFREDVEAGGLAAYGPSLPAQYRQAAGLVDKVLRGASPGNLPVERPTTFELSVNAKTARALGLAIPASLRLRANTLID
jgi:putative ABC transport system substrate-binding protein